MQHAAPESLKSLIRGEISAVETYRRAKEKFSSEPGFHEIHQIEEEHEDAMRHLRSLYPGFQEDVKESGAWGRFATTMTEMAKVGGYKATLKVLKEGEEHGIKEYEAALQDADLAQREILNKYLAKQHQHIAVLDKHLAN